MTEVPIFKNAENETRKWVLESQISLSVSACWRNKMLRLLKESFWRYVVLSFPSFSSLGQNTDGEKNVTES